MESSCAYQPPIKDVMVCVEKLNLEKTDIVVVRNDKLFVEYEKCVKTSPIFLDNEVPNQICCTNNICDTIIVRVGTGFKESKKLPNSTSYKDYIFPKNSFVKRNVKPIIYRKHYIRSCYVPLRRIEEQLDFMAYFGLKCSYTHDSRLKEASSLKLHRIRNKVKPCKVVLPRLKLN